MHAIYNFLVFQELIGNGFIRKKRDRTRTFFHQPDVPATAVNSFYQSKLTQKKV